MIDAVIIVNIASWKAFDNDVINISLESQWTKCNDLLMNSDSPGQLKIKVKWEMDGDNEYYQ